MECITISAQGQRLYVAAPYDPGWANRARTIIGSRWRGDLKVWTFPLDRRGEVVTALRTVFGGRYLVPKGE